MYFTCKWAKRNFCAERKRLSNANINAQNMQTAKENYIIQEFMYVHIRTYIQKDALSNSRKIKQIRWMLTHGDVYLHRF